MKIKPEKEYKVSKKYFCNEKETILNKIYRAIYEECSKPFNTINENALEALLDAGKSIGGKDFDSSRILQTIISEYKARSIAKIQYKYEISKTKNKEGNKQWILK